MIPSKQKDLPREAEPFIVGLDQIVLGRGRKLFESLLDVLDDYPQLSVLLLQLL